MNPEISESVINRQKRVIELYRDALASFDFSQNEKEELERKLDRERALLVRYLNELSIGSEAAGSANVTSARAATAHSMSSTARS